MIAWFGRNRLEAWETLAEAVIREFQTGYEFQYWDLDTDELLKDALELPDDERTLAGLIDLFYRRYGEKHADGKKRWGDKTMPGDCNYLDKIGLVFPEADYIHILRDGRDCLASAKQYGMFQGDLVKAAYHWKSCVNQWRRFVSSFARPEACYLLKYENLVADPQQEVAQLCQLMSIQPSTAMLEFRGATDMRDVNSIKHHENVRKPISPSSIGRWKTQFSQSDLQTIMAIIGRELRAMGYE